MSPCLLQAKEDRSTPSQCSKRKKSTRKKTSNCPSPSPSPPPKQKPKSPSPQIVKKNVHDNDDEHKETTRKEAFTIPNGGAKTTATTMTTVSPVTLKSSSGTTLKNLINVQFLFVFLLPQD